MYLIKGVIEIASRILLLIGTSGAGKTVLGQHLETLGIPQLISHTTRTPRKDEIDGTTYHYISKEEFDKLDKLEQTYYAGNYYCLSRQEVERHEEDLVYCIVDQFGVKQIKQNFGNVVTIYVHIDQRQQEERLRKRGDSEDEIKKRIIYSIQNDEVKNDIEIADYIITNNNLETSKQILEYIVKEIRNEETFIS